MPIRTHTRLPKLAHADDRIGKALGEITQVQALLSLTAAEGGGNAVRELFVLGA